MSELNVKCYICNFSYMFMTSRRRAFLQKWRTVATIIFFADVFFDFKVFNYSGIIIAIFMWITGGYIASFFFGESPRRQSKSSFYVQKEFDQQLDMPPKQNSMEVSKPITTSTFCTFCGSTLEASDKFCPECGAQRFNA